MRGSSVIARGSGVPSKPTRSTSTPCADSACAWYRMRALRPRSTSATTTALMTGMIAGAVLILPAAAVVPKARQQICRDTPPVLGGRSHVVHRNNLLEQDPLGVG